MTMPAESIPAVMTAEELTELQLPGKSTELVRGRLVVREPPSTWHGQIQENLAYFISHFVREHHLGVVFGQDTGFKVASDPDTVRAPDVAFVSQARSDRIPKQGYAALAPDLVAEIVSPGDRAGELLAKVADWLQAGTQLVWVIDPQRVEARVHHPDGSVRVIPADGELDGEDVLAGFTCTLADVLN